MSSAKKQGSRLRRARAGAAAGEGRRLARLPAADWRGWPWTVFGWGLLVQAVSIAASPLRSAPVGLFLFGDSLHYLEWGRLWLEGAPLDGGLPFHPPLVGWLTVPLWAVLGEPPTVFLAAKLLMALVNAAGYALFFRLLRERLPLALPICLLLPLSFGELALASAVNSESVYRLLLLGLLLLGRRLPLVGGLLHGAACLTRAEHLPVALAVGAIALARSFRGVASGGGVDGRPGGRALRAWLGWTVAGAVLVLVPQTVASSRALAAYNRQHADQLPEPLPTVVPVSFYGPLNFALAQREADIFFARRTLPPAPGGMEALDPRFAPHNEAIVDGYRLGFEAIVRAPGRFFRRALAKAAHSLGALTHGWTWRDLPKDREWIRRPVDVAHAPAPLWGAFCFLMIGVGAWRLRRSPTLLWVGGLLVAYRLVVDVAFFPYLRGMAVAAPFYLALFWTGVAGLGGRHAGRLLAAALVALSIYHFATVAGERPYRLAGERRADGTLIDDREVRIRLGD